MVIEAHGGIDALKMKDIPDPAVGPGQVRVRIKAVALNRLDLWVRMGWKGLRLEMPHILGSDVAGVIDELGADVSGFLKGDPVVLGPGVACGRCLECLSGRDNRCALYAILGEHTRGGYAELLTVPARNVFKKPDKLTFEEAACLPLVFTTAWGMLIERAHLKQGETVLVQAAGSGVGSAAIQVAKLMGTTVIATASTDAKLERARALGADHVVNYKKDDFKARVREITKKRGVDVVVEHTGGDTFGDSVLSLAVGGRLVTCGATSRFTAEIDIRYLFARHLSILGNTMGPLASMIPILEHAKIGALRPVLDRVLPLDHAAEAHTLLENRGQFGKVVLVP